MKDIFMIQLGCDFLQATLENDAKEVKVFKIQIQHKFVFLEREVAGNIATWKIQSHSEDVDLNKFKNILPSIKTQINEHLIRRARFID